MTRATKILIRIRSWGLTLWAAMIYYLLELRIPCRTIRINHAKIIYDIVMLLGSWIPDTSVCISWIWITHDVLYYAHHTLLISYYGLFMEEKKQHLPMLN